MDQVEDRINNIVTAYNK